MTTDIELDQPVPYEVAAETDQHVMIFDPEPDDDGVLPLAGLIDIVSAAIDDCSTLIDTLPQLRNAEPSSPDTYAWDMARRKAYLDAEDHCSKAWQALTHAQQLIKGLAR